MATAPTQLSLYNRALRILGEGRLSALTENRPVRQTLDGIWADNIIKVCLEQGLWNFAMRAREMSYSADVTPDFGYQYAFDKPSDWVRTAAFCSDEYYQEPILQYSDEAQYWFCDLQTVWVKYVSDDASFGSDMTLWPEAFTNFVAHEMALQAAPTHVSGERRLMLLERKHRDARLKARSTDAMNEAPLIPATGSFVRARLGGQSRLDRGNRGSFTG